MFMSTFFLQVKKKKKKKKKITNEKEIISKGYKIYYNLNQIFTKGYKIHQGHFLADLNFVQVAAHWWKY